MKKDKKFLIELEKNLDGVSSKNKENIIKKYENIIKEEKEQKKKITVILKELGDPKEIALKEKELLGRESFVFKLKEKYNGYKNKFKEFIKKKKEEKKDSSKKEAKELKKKLKEEKSKLKKEEKELKKKIKEEQKELKNKESKKDSLKKNNFWTLLTKDISIKKKLKKKEEKESIIVTYEEEKTTPKDIVSDIKEEIQDDISEVSEIVTEKRLFESKSDRRKRILLKTLGIIFTIILMFVWLWIAIIFIASIFAYLDGVKFIGINIALGGLTLLVFWIIIMINRAIFKKKSNLVLNLVVTFLSLIVIAVGVVLGIKQISQIKTVKDVSVKYSMTNKLSTYTLPTDIDQKFTITFNSNYNTQYTMNYDDTLKNKIRIEVKYYECYYDYYMKETSNSTYISLKLDDRDRLSVYIDDLKEGLVFDNDELSRYVVRITVNPKDASRLVIQD